MVRDHELFAAGGDDVGSRNARDPDKACKTVKLMIVSVTFDAPCEEIVKTNELDKMTWPITLTMI